MDNGSAAEGPCAKHKRNTISNSHFFFTAACYPFHSTEEIHSCIQDTQAESPEELKSFYVNRKVDFLLSFLLLYTNTLCGAKKKKKKREGNERKMDQLKPPGKITFKGNLAEN